eukprot:CAMPEP_0117031850 /NCGR_PEP_ID=MMETSP0472-20121206/22856_1 /TAXON_ID=693140 ORGANISM="Tiarina fusus, Strain LIS" /NCGR_SAMPLE_ID=MMETSP0472 /ASSEMBLY_ACC=CAM_ASM_000603 /LENGTH=325 /DNA_ID=CAMNT_0004740283 /DNA_START=88 /DNA_END=1065 /DNA_ORIENTATION=-
MMNARKNAASVMILAFLVVLATGDARDARSTTFRGSHGKSRLPVHPIKLRGGSSQYPAPRTPPKTVPFGASQQQQQQQQQTPRQPPETQTGVSTKEMLDAFLTRDSRNTFIARVYLILSGQLLVTAGSCFLFGLYPPLANYRMQNAPILTSIPLIGILASTIAWFRICTSVKARREAPEKWWWLAIYTLGEAISVGFLSSFYTMRSVISAMGATLQQNPKYDLSQWGATLSSWAMVLFVYIMMGIVQEVGLLPKGFLPYSDMVFSAFASLLFSAFLAYHTKLIVGGKHTKYRMTEKDYVFGAMSLYTDIVNIFLNLLQLLGDMKE